MNKSNFKQLQELTDFERSVLEVIQKIPKGRLATYQSVARAIGRPLAVRAVGNAVNKNPLILKIPCHCIVKSDGQIGGFGAGVKNKIKFLTAEGIKLEGNKRIKNLNQLLYTFK